MRCVLSHQTFNEQENMMDIRQHLHTDRRTDNRSVSVVDLDIAKCSSVIKHVHTKNIMPQPDFIDMHNAV